jgi:cell division septum initiation protein DivIVA
MNENTDLLPNLSSQEDAFEVQLRGYSRRQVDEFVARCRSQVRELEERLGRSLDETEQLRQETQTLRQAALGNKPAHEEVSERISQILKLADDEAKAQKNRADGDIKKQLSDAQHEADHMTADAHKKADNALSAAKAQAKQTLDEATARAAAIHDGAERRLNLLSTRHAETIRRLTDILDGVSGLVAAETARPSLEDEVDQNVAKAIGQKTGEAGNGGQNPNAANAATAANPAMAPARPGNGTPLGDAAARGQRTAPGGPGGPSGPGAPVPPGAPRPAGAPRTGAGVPAAPAGQPGSQQPGTPGQPPVHDPVLVHPRGGAHEAPRGGAHEAPRGRQLPPTVPAPAPLPADQLRPGTSGPGPDGEERPGRPSPAHRATDSNYTGTIDKDETTEGVRIVREQRQH